MEASAEDLELVNALQWAPRAPFSALAEILGRHPTRLAAAWERLQSEGIAWIMAYRTPSPGSTFTAFVELSLAPGSFATAIPWLCRLPHVTSVEEGVLNADVRLTVMADSFRSFATELQGSLRADPRVTRIHTAIVTRVFNSGSVWRLGALAPAQERALAQLGTADLGPARGRGEPRGFAAMERALIRDGRADIKELAQAMDVHPATAGRRLRQAREEGALDFRCDMAQHLSGYPLLCQWYVWVPPADMDAVASYLATLRTQRGSMAVTGDSNLTFMVWLRHEGEIHRIERDLLRKVPSLQVLHSDVGLRVHKRMGHMIDVDSRATGEVIPW